MPTQTTTPQPHGPASVAAPLYETVHAMERRAQRHLPLADVGYVVAHGTALRRAGFNFYVLLAADVPVHDRELKRVKRLEGTTVLVGGHGRDLRLPRA